MTLEFRAKIFQVLDPIKYHEIHDRFILNAIKFFMISDIKNMK